MQYLCQSLSPRPPVNFRKRSGVIKAFPCPGGPYPRDMSTICHPVVHFILQIVNTRANPSRRNSEKTVISSRVFNHG
ncbi:hypothetical protein DCMF_09050 [Candidatus Formimonas warabiya]|uniref:Uncharacterized protein n=1 Tax=Formimonas warabiya TaxID=1761012 RepID=A0A3G1KR34_FORW1|nr:hypothetical protein DCMF_09050 [Candidatus Formimonas warabiya]